MKQFDKILMKYREETGISNWPETAKALDLSLQGLWYLRNGRGTLKGDILEKLTKTTGISAPLIFAIWKAENERNPLVREAWKKHLENFKGEFRLKEDSLINQADEEMYIMLSRASHIYKGHRHKNQEFRESAPSPKKSGFSPMRIRCSVTSIAPEEGTPLAGIPAARWNGIERRKHQGPWKGPERRAA